MVPFVGAGLSAFCGYPSWPRVLTKMCGNIRDQSKQEIVRKQIEEGLLIEAAQEILNGYPYFLRRFPEEFSPKLLEECSDAAMRSSAAWMLPYLFPEAPAVTTNFDQVLETVYERSQHRFTDILGPQQLCQRAQARQQRHHSLLKLHGSIGKTIDRNAIVFTKEQYDQAYQSDSRLVAELTELFQNDTLLFLGCSLQMDRTLEVLKNLQPDGSYLTHFAILGCAPDKFDDRSEQLEKLGIIPIFYDDSDPRNHDSVRVILEHLLYETNPDAYQKLDDEMRRFVGPVKRDDVLMYNAGRIKYVGRTAELAELERFCSSPATNAWWAITGPGGMGKSRLIYEFTNQKQREGWQILWFSRDQYDQLAELRLPAENTIVVLDDVQADTQTAGEWLKAMRTYSRINRLRILMIEREGKDYASADWLRVLRSGNPYNDPLATWCYNKAFLHLEPLTDDALKEIMSSCAEALGKPIDPDSLLAALNQVDGELRRPLYALAIAEAACNGDDPLHWDPNRVLDEMLNRELAFHYESLQYILKEQPTASVQEELEKLMAQCCIYGHLDVAKVTAEEYPYLTDCMDRMSPSEFFRCLGLLHTEDGKLVLRMNCPDLIKEHLVLRLAFEQQSLNLLPDGWHLDTDYVLFVYRLWYDCPDRLKDETTFWDRFFSTPAFSGFPAKLYGMMLWGCTNIFPNLAQRAVNTLKKLYNKSENDRDIAKSFAKGLFNLACVQSLEDQASTVELMKELCDSHPDCQEIAIEYADGLYNLSCDQPPEKQASIVYRLRELFENYPDWQEVADRYAKGLLKLSCDQSPEDQAATIDRLKALHDSHPDWQKVTIRYAMSLVNLFLNQAPADCEQTAGQIGILYDNHPNITKLAQLYAGCLVNLSFQQTALPSVHQILTKSKDILDRYPDDPDIQISYAETWFNLTLVQSESDIPTTVSDIAAFLRDHPGAIPEFRDALEEYLSEHPDHVARYQPLLELGGDEHA